MINNNGAINDIPKSKTNILISIMVICSVVFVGIGVLLFINRQNSYLDDSAASENDNYHNQMEEEQQLTVEDKGILINNLMVLGIELYDSGKYLELPKSNTSGYYVTVSQLKSMGYSNIDSLVMNCSDDHAVIFFDVDHIEKYSSGYPILAVYDCSEF